MRQALLILLCILFQVYAENVSTDQLLSDGDKALFTGDFSEAIKNYDKVLEQNPNSYMALYKRATVFLSTGKQKAALLDLKAVLKLKPDSEQAMLQYGKLLLRYGNFDQADDQFSKLLKLHPENKDNANLLLQSSKSSELLQEANALLKASSFSEAVDLLSDVISVAPSSVAARKYRAECYLRMERWELCLNDIRRVQQINSEDLWPLRHMVYLHVLLGETDEATRSIKQCMHLDPEDSLCLIYHRLLRKIKKGLDSGRSANQNQNFNEAIQSFQMVYQVLNDFKMAEWLQSDQNSKKLTNFALPSDSPSYTAVDEGLCKAYSKMKEHEKAISHCDKVLKVNPHNYDSLCNRADSYLAKEDYEQALKDFAKAHEIDNNERRAQDGYHQAQKLLKISKQKDYYKVLQVPRDASQKEIRKAYRKAAHEWHPDKHSAAKAKEIAERKMSEINQAYEVLNDEELRKRFDSGDDPNDQNGQQGHPQHGFFQNGQQFVFNGFPGGFPFQQGQNSHFNFKFGS